MTHLNISIDPTTEDQGTCLVKQDSPKEELQAKETGRIYACYT